MRSPLAGQHVPAGIEPPEPLGPTLRSGDMELALARAEDNLDLSPDA